MNKLKKIISSILIVLVFLCLILPKSNANFFTDDDDDKEDSEIIKTIDNDDGGIFEKIIAKMIGGIAETVFDLTTKEELGVGFKNYDELIFAKDSIDISPFTEEQWNSMMSWYGIMAGVAGSLVLIVIVIVSYKLITSSYSIEKRSEAKDSLMRLFFGIASIGFAPIFIKFLLLINNNLVKMLIGLSDHKLEDLIGNSVVTNVQTGNAIATAVVIALFAYLFFKINVKFIIRQFTILIFTLFTPIVSIMWMINRRTIGASIWFGQILINVFMQFIYAFLFLVYMEFLPQSGGWATSILWAMMILPLADALQNTLQNLVSRIAGINNEELANRGIGMAGAMAYSIKTIAYQFKNNEGENGTTNNTNILGKIFGKESIVQDNSVTPMQTKQLDTKPMQTNNISKTDDSKNINKDNIKNHSKKDSIVGYGKAAINTGKEFMNMGMYAAEGRNFRHNRNSNRQNINNTRKGDFINKNKEENIIANMQDKDK